MVLRRKRGMTLLKEIGFDNSQAHGPAREGPGEIIEPGGDPWSHEGADDDEEDIMSEDPSDVAE